RPWSRSAGCMPVSSSTAAAGSSGACASSGAPSAARRRGRLQGRLDVGAAIRRVFDIYVDQAPVLMPAAAVVFVFTGIVTGVLVTLWSVAAPVVVLERPPGLGALARSRELVRGNGWQVFGVIFVLGILVSVLAAAIDIAAQSAGTGLGIVVRVILGVLTAPLSALAAAVLYFELRGARQPDATTAAPPADAGPAGE